MLAALRRASSRVSRCAVERRRSVLEMALPERAILLDLRFYLQVPSRISELVSRSIETNCVTPDIAGLVMITSFTGVPS